MMYGKQIILLLFWYAAFQVSFTPHPLKATSTHIVYIPEKKELHVSISIFRDDFQKSMNTELNSRFNLMEYYNGKEASDAVYKFLNRFLSIKINGKALVLKCDGAVNDDDKNSFVYTTIIKNCSFKGSQKMEIANTLLLNYFPNQTNVVVINIPGKIKRMIQFDKDLTTDTITF